MDHNAALSHFERLFLHPSKLAPGFLAHPFRSAVVAKWYAAFYFVRARLLGFIIAL
ncbi:MAG: hypothetical protein ACO1HP_07580 [Bacteroidota bacterium]